jgi:hypothetical protein
VRYVHKPTECYASLVHRDGTLDPDFPVAVSIRDTGKLTTDGIMGPVRLYELRHDSVVAFVAACDLIVARRCINAPDRWYVSVESGYGFDDKWGRV